MCGTRSARSHPARTVAQGRPERLDAHDRRLAGELLADVGRDRPPRAGRSASRGTSRGQARRDRPGARGDDLVGQEPGVDRLEGRAELGRVVAGDDGELAGRGEEEVERDQALAGGRRGLLQDELDRLRGSTAAGSARSARPVRAPSRSRAVAAIALPEGVALS